MQDNVAIYFDQPSVSLIFSQLLAAHGYSPIIIEHFSQIPAQTRLVTEVKLYNDLSSEAKTRCLVVGTEHSLKNSSIDAPCLTQPLTEAKVEAALIKLEQI